jgi:diketogulonate reductase-like aldo/keto reductase
VLTELQAQGMALIAYSPVGRGAAFRDRVLQRIGAAHGKNPGQAALRWLLQQGVAAIPRSSREANVEANLRVFDFTLTDGEMAEIAALAHPDGRMVRPAVAPAWD